MTGSLPELAQDVDEANALLDEGGYVDADGDGWRDMPDGSELNVLITPQYNKTRQALYLRIAEVLKTNLEAVGVQTTMDEESVRNSDHATEVRKQGTYELYIGYTSPGVAMYDTAFMYMIGDNDNNAGAPACSRSLSPPMRPRRPPAATRRTTPP